MAFFDQIIQQHQEGEWTFTYYGVDPETGLHVVIAKSGPDCECEYGEGENLDEVYAFVRAKTQRVVG